MTVGLKTDPQVVAEVIGLKIKDPKKSERSFERDGLVPKSTAHDILTRYFGRIDREEDLVNAIIKQDLENVAIGGLVISNTLSKNENGVQPKELSAVASAMSDATKRRQLMTDGATENVTIGVQTYLPEKD